MHKQHLSRDLHPSLGPRLNLVMSLSLTLLHLLHPMTLLHPELKAAPNVTATAVTPEVALLLVLLSLRSLLPLPLAYSTLIQPSPKHSSESCLNLIPGATNPNLDLSQATSTLGCARERRPGPAKRGWGSVKRAGRSGACSG